MASLDDKQQLLQNTQALMMKVAEASDAALTFAKSALEVSPQDVMQSEPKAEVVRLATKALKAGTRGAEVATDLSTQCIEIAEALEDMYGDATEEGDSGPG